MADEGNVISDLNLGNGADNAPSAGILTQYVKDLSVENPNAPQSFQWQEQQNLDVQLNMGSRQVEGELYELELKLTCSSGSDAGALFVVELSYCALVGMRNLSTEQMQAFLYGEAPQILFPFARRVLSDAIREAGFSTHILNNLYLQQFQNQQGQQQAATDVATAEPAGHA